MRIQVTSDNIDLSPSMTALANKKISKIQRRLKDVSEELKNVRVVLNMGPQETFVVRVELTVSGNTFFSEEKDFSLESALIGAIDDVDRQYMKSKLKNESEDWEVQRESKRFPLEEVEDEED